jgi:hypothetical protein
MNINVSIIQLIYNILSNDAETRDDWMLCLKEIHSIEMKIHGISKEEYFMKLYVKNDKGEYDYFTNFQTIIRLWRKVQEDYPHLRGENWEERQKQGGQYNVNSYYEDSQLSFFTQEQLDEFAKIDFSKFIK